MSGIDFWNESKEEREKRKELEHKISLEALENVLGETKQPLPSSPLPAGPLPSPMPSPLPSHPLPSGPLPSPLPSGPFPSGLLPSSPLPSDIEQSLRGTKEKE